MLATTIILNVLLIAFLVITGSKRNIESRTEREAKILKEYFKEKE